MTRKMKKFLGMALSVVSIASLTIPSVYARQEMTLRINLGLVHFTVMDNAVQIKIDKLVIRPIDGK